MIFYEIKRKVYYLLTQTNAEVAFQSELFLRENANWIMKRPIKYALCLVNMNIKQALGLNQYKELNPGVHSLHRVVKRQKVYQISGIISKSDVLLIDIFNVLFIQVSLKNGQKMYLENHYIKKIIDTAKNNDIKVIGIGSKRVSEKKTKNILEKYKIELDELRIPKVSTKKKLVKKMLCDIYAQKKDTSFEYPCVVISSDFNGTIKATKEKYGHAIYYRPVSKLMDMVAMEKLESDFGKIHRAICGLEAFSGEQNHSKIFECAYLIIAPILYIMMEEIQQKKKDATVVILGDEESLFANLYQAFYKDAKVIAWSSLASHMPEDEKEWCDLLEDSIAFNKIPANRAAYSMGFESEEEIIQNNKDEFVKEALLHQRKDENAIMEYVKRALDGERKILVVDAFGEEISLSNFAKIAEELGIEVETVSIKEYLYENEEIEGKVNLDIEEDKENESEEEEQEALEEDMEEKPHLLTELKTILSFAVPYMTTICENEIGFAYPDNMQSSKRNLIEGAMIQYFQTYQQLKRQYPAIEPPTKEDAKMISHVDPSTFKNITKGGKIV